MGKIITVASGKGGTGKTTSVAALASCLASLGYKTLCIDFDTGMGNLDLALGMTDYTIMDYSDVLSKKVDLASACSESPYIPNLFFLAAPVSGEMTEKDKDAVADMFCQIRKTFDYCIIDSPPGIGEAFKLSHTGVDMSIIVTTGELPSMRDATRAVGALREMGLEAIRLIVNKVKPENLKYISATIDDIIDITGARLIGLVMEDENIFRALHNNTPLILYRKRKSVYDFLDAARRITGADIPLKQV